MHPFNWSPSRYHGMGTAFPPYPIYASFSPFPHGQSVYQVPVRGSDDTTVDLTKLVISALSPLGSPANSHPTSPTNATSPTQRRVLSRRSSVYFSSFQEEIRQKRAKAITKIQSVMRGALVRSKLSKERLRLSHSLYKKAAQYAKKTSLALVESAKRGSLVPAVNGRTPVYFVRQASVVLKKSGIPANSQRYSVMQEAHDLLQQRGWGRLYIPSARVCGRFLVERKAPITKWSPLEQVGLYIENRELFTEAVRQFTALCCENLFTDLVGYHHCFRGITDKLGRVDNVPLFIESKIGWENGIKKETKVGKIALIDLEHFRLLNRKHLNSMDLLAALETAITLFPCHYQDIVEVGSQYGHLESIQFRLEIAMREALESFQSIYFDHRKYLESLGVSLSTPFVTPLANIDGVKKASLIRDCQEVIRRKGHFYPMSTGAIDAFIQEEVPKLVEMVSALVMRLICKRFATAIDKPPSAFDELIHLRSFVDFKFWKDGDDPESFSHEVYLELVKNAYGLPLNRLKDFNTFIILTVLQKLAAHGLVSSFHSGTNGCYDCCLFV